MGKRLHIELYNEKSCDRERFDGLLLRLWWLVAFLRACQGCIDKNWGISEMNTGLGDLKGAFDRRKKFQRSLAGFGELKRSRDVKKREGKCWSEDYKV
jgi:hypothetical protein